MTVRRAWAALFISAFGGMSACGDGQAPPDYRGEPLMSLKGIVISSEAALTEDLVPMLVLGEPGPMLRPEPTTWFIQGEVEGSFPSSFTLRIYDPPPASTFDTLVEGEAKFAKAWITAGSPQHPKRLTAGGWVENFGEGQIQVGQLCSETECLSRRYDCPIGDGDPNREWPCGGKFPEELHWTTYGYSETHSIVYFASDVPAGSVLSHEYARGAAIAAGYHVVESDAAAVEADRACYDVLDERVAREWNIAHDRGNSGASVRFDAFEESIEYNKLYSVAAAEADCDTGLRVLEDTASAPVRLTFVENQPPDVFF